MKAGTKGQMKCCMQVSLWSVFKTTKLTKVFYLSKQKLENPLMWPCECFAWVSLFDGCQFPVFFKCLSWKFACFERDEAWVFVFEVLLKAFC